MKKIFIYLFLFLILLNSSFGIKSYNSSLGNMTLEGEGWCPNLEIKFKVYNQSEFLNKKTIEGNLCGVNETPANDNCQIFQSLVPNVKIYNGPVDSLPTLFDAKANSSGEFKLTFPSSNSYLVEMSGLTNFNDYYEPYIEISSCKWANKNEILNTTNETKIVKYYNQSYIYGVSKIEIVNTTINSSSNLTLKTGLKFSILGITFLNNSNNIFKITSTSKNFSSLKITIPLTFQNKSNLKLYFYDAPSKKWNKVSNFKIEGVRIIVTDANLGIYSVVEEEEIIIKTPIPNPIIEEKKVEKNITKENITTSNEDKSGKFSITYYVIGIVIFLIIGIGTFYFINRKKKSENVVAVHNSTISTNSVTGHIDNEVLNSYEQVYNHSKDYVSKYKNNFSKDQIYRSLKTANVPKDIIDKVFSEEFE